MMKHYNSNFCSICFYVALGICMNIIIPFLKLMVILRNIMNIHLIGNFLKCDFSVSDNYQ